MRFRFSLVWAAAIVIAAALVFAPSAHVVDASPSGVVISAVYGGGGNGGASYSHDYIELFNAGSSPVSLDGWSVQYSDGQATDFHWEKTFLPDIMLPAGGYFLARQDEGMTCQAPPNGLCEAPPDDAQGSASISSTGSVSVAIVRSMDTIEESTHPYDDPDMDGLVEDVFGAGQSIVYEGSVRTGVFLDNTLAWFRKGNGCQDTDNSFNDFVFGTAYPNARSLATTPAPCSSATGSDGTIESTESVTSGGAVTVTVVDADLAGTPQIVITAAASTGDNENLVIAESGTPGTFTAMFTVADVDVPTDNNGTLEAADGTITFTYVDALDAEGDVNSSRTDLTTVNPATPTGTTGSITSTASVNVGDEVTVTVVDADLANDGSVDIEAEGTAGDTETLTLTETVTLGTFSATFTIHDVAPPVDDNDMLEEPSGSITFTYVDALDAEGDVDTELTAETDVVPAGPTGTTGSITSTPSVNVGEEVTVTVVDADLENDGSVEVMAEGTEGDTETLTLTETGTVGTFTGTFTIHDVAPPVGDNDMLEEPAGSITFTYVDALDAEGDVDTELTAVTDVIPDIPTGATGSITSTPTIASGSSVTVTVVDADLEGTSTLTVEAEGSSGDTETLTLNETGTLGTFSGTFTVHDVDVPTDDNDLLEEADGTITFTYVDALDAEGDIDTELTAQTTVTVAPLAAFEIVSPQTGTILRDTTVTLTWTHSAGADTYDVYLSHLSTNTRLGETYVELDIDAATVCTAGSCSIPSTDLVAELEHGTWSWTVVASGETEAEAANGPQLFTVALDAGIELVVNGGFEDGATGWTLKGNSAKIKCGDKGAGSDCMLQLKSKASAKQKNMMGDVLANTESMAGDVLQVSAAIQTNRADPQTVVTVVVNYASPTAGVKLNGKDKIKLSVAEVTAGFQTFSESIELADAIVDGKVSIKYRLNNGKLRVDDVSVQLMPVGTTLPPRTDIRGATQPDGILPPPAAPDSFRGGN